MIEHKLLRGAGAEVYLPFARSKLQALERQDPEGFFSQWFLIDGWRIHVKQEPPFQYIDIEFIGGLAYEFFTSEHINDQTLASPDHAHGIQFSYVCGSATRTVFDTKGKVTATSPRYSSALTAPDLKKWPLLDCESTQTPATRLITWRSWQNQKFFEYTWHPGNDGKSLVTSTLAQMPGWANQSGMYSPYCYARFGNVNSFVSDYTLDITPTLYTSGASIGGAPRFEHGWLFWRRAAVQTVGGRSFFILTDNYGRFHVYPVKDYKAPVTAFKTYTPPYPAWVTVPDPNDFTKQFAQWLWRFNRDATKCVTVAFNSQDTGFLKYLDNGSFFCAILPEDSADIVPQLALTNAHEDRPGLVEFGIAITLTGSGDLDFDVAFTALRTSYFEDHGRFFFDAAYYLKDVERNAKDPAFIAEDTLMTAEIACLTPAGYFAPGPVSNTWATEAVDACRQMFSSVVINANDVNLAPTQKLTFPALGPTWFQFPTITGIRGTVAVNGLDVQTIPTLTGSRNFSPAGPGIYDPDNHVVPGRPYNGPLNVGTTFGFLYALELSTLSLSYEVDDEVAGTVSIRAVAYGTEFYRYDGLLGYTLPAPTLLAADVPVPSFRPHQAAFNFVINTAFGDGFNVHPAGHWSYNPGGFRNADLPIEHDLDWISVVAGKDALGNLLRVRYRHKDQFNAAFAQVRDYPFYHEAFPGEALGDFGSFRTAGFWITFR